MRSITLADCRRHFPDKDASPKWQESFYLGWVDLRHRACGAHHISLAPGGQKDTHVWSWTMVDGIVIGRSQEHSLGFPDGDFDDLTLGSLRLRSKETRRDLSLTAQYHGSMVELNFHGNCDPQEMPLNLGDTVLGDRHYEIMGMVDGRIDLGDRSIPIAASGWTDHSWGPRDFSTNLSHRWLWASFGADFSISAFNFVTNEGMFYTGWAWDDGEVFPVTHAEFHATVNDDGITPEGCDAIIRTTGNRSYRVRGRSRDSALMGGVGWHAKNGLTEYECGGRMGEGLLEVNELKVLTRAMKTELGL
jgi:hypothetical protein